VLIIRGTVLGVLLTCLSLPPANAYLDPGTGSIIIQSIFAALAAVVVFFGFVKSSIINFIRKLLRIGKS
jgi:uncharacterized oligopeptide transporter (OPT) family protein